MILFAILLGLFMAVAAGAVLLMAGACVGIIAFAAAVSQELE